MAAEVGREYRAAAATDDGAGGYEATTARGWRDATVALADGMVVVLDAPPLPPFPLPPPVDGLLYALFCSACCFAERPRSMQIQK